MASHKEGNLSQAWLLYEAGEFASAIKRLEEARDIGCDCPAALVLKARALQLLDDPGPMSEISACLDEAIQIDPQYAPAHLEYGWFLLNVLDKPLEAEAQFRRSLEILRGQNTEAAIGIAKCLSEMNPQPGAQCKATVTLPDLLDSARLGDALEG